MRTDLAFQLAQANKGKQHKVFDWDKAAKYIVEHNVKNASAGLESDWENTGGEILENGNPVPQTDTYTYLSSNWATPQLETDDEIIDCWCYNDAWDADTYWPESALVILSGLVEGS